MARIPVYDANVNPEAPLPGRSPERLYAEPDSFGGGKGLSVLGEGLSDASTTLYDAEQREEVSNVRTQMATMRGQMTAKFIQGSAASNGDPSYTQQFNEELANQLSTFGGQLNTKAGMMAFQQESASMTSDFLAKGVEHNVVVAGAKATSDYHAMVNQNAGTLFTDPTQANSIFKNLDNAFADPNGPYANVPAEQRSALQNGAREQLAVAAARGVAMMNPDMAEKMYKADQMPGQQFLTEGGNAQVVSYITSMQNAARTKATMQMAMEERQKRMADEGAANSIVASLVKNPNDPGAVDMIMHSALTPEHKIMMLGLAGHSLTDQAHDQNTYGQGFYQAYQDIADGKIKDYSDLVKQVGPNGSLTVAGVNMLNGELNGRGTAAGKNEVEMKTAFVKAASQQLSGTNEFLHLRDPNGDKQMASALAWFLPAYEQAKGKPDFDPSVALDPNNSKSLWAGVMRFKRSPQQQMQDMMYANPGAPIGTTSAPNATAKPAKTMRFEDLPAGGK